MEKSAMKHNALHAAIAAAALLFGTAAFAGENPATATATKAKSTQYGAGSETMHRPAASATSAQLNAADRRFLDQALQSSAAEVEFGKLAEQKAGSDEVRNFGRMMQQDHAGVASELKALDGHAAMASDKADKAAKMARLSAEQQRKADELRRLDGAAFDAAYAAEMVRMHRKDVELFEKTANDSAHGPEVRQLAQAKLPALRDHLRQAENLEQRTAALDD
jgi:putative membrane protein